MINVVKDDLSEGEEDEEIWRWRGSFSVTRRESYRPPDFRCSRPPDGPTTDSVPRTARNRIFPRDQVLVFFLILFFLFFLVKFLSFLSLSNRHFQWETRFHHKKKKKKKRAT
jgi:hypothetical protein